ncbi:hypothetical protein MTR_4g124005 [Medicago truncatula]|uniref:Uncharacterized protein n=1 Tax=Medicago truncatula TaxID=3880 RepID=A0A072UTL9_MEDTR|nr:hypothetical protein MTR_4g124005 [Medicago truncatula]
MVDDEKTNKRRDHQFLGRIQDFHSVALSNLDRNHANGEVVATKILTCESPDTPKMAKNCVRRILTTRYV